MSTLSDRDQAVLRSIFDPTATVGDVDTVEDTFSEIDEELDVESWKSSRELCLRGVQLSEEGNHVKALEVLNQSVAATPARPAAYNDRAQLFRLLGRDDDAVVDLKTAIQLTTGKKTRARGQALCQYGLILRKRGQDNKARETFAEAAKLGSAFAKKQMVELNPYAALCNQMLSQVMKGETNIKL